MVSFLACATLEKRVLTLPVVCEGGEHALSGIGTLPSSSTLFPPPLTVLTLLSMQTLSCPMLVRLFDGLRMTMC